jgi:hypothetical protein
MQSRLIKNREKAAQLLAFDGLKWGRAGCTDIDCSLDWKGRTFIFVEVKTEGVVLSMGQKYHLEALVDAIRAGGKVAYAITAYHQTPLSQDVHVAQTRAHKVYDGSSWDLASPNARLIDVLNDMYHEHLNEVA